MLSLLQERKRAKLTDAELETVGDQRSRVSLKWREKAAHELVGVQRHRLGLVLGAVILPPKADAAIVAIQKTAIGELREQRLREAIAQGLAAALSHDLARGQYHHVGRKVAYSWRM